MTDTDLALQACRETFLRAWTPPYATIPSGPRAALTELWTELQAVERVKAWKSVAALAGQLVEALLRERIASTGQCRPVDLLGKTLGQLIQIARPLGILPDQDDPLTGAATISTTLALRNWASHAALWYGQATALRTTQALALTICTVESLYPRPRAPFVRVPKDASSAWWLKSWNSLPPVVLLGELEQIGASALWDVFKREPALLFGHVLRLGSAKSFQRLHVLTARAALDQGALRNCIQVQFADLVMNASRSTCKYLAEVVWRLRTLDLHVHAKVFGILLPIDAHLLARLLESRSAAWVARYVDECSRAEPRLFAEMASNKRKMSRAVSAFWRTFGDASGNIINMANILHSMPWPTKVSILDAAPIDLLLDWVRRSPPRDSVNLLPSLRNRLLLRAEHLRTLRDSLLSALADAIHATSPSGLHEIPLRLQRLRMVNDPVAVQVLREALSSAVSRFDLAADDWSAVRRIIWDTYAFCDALRAEAISGSKLALDGSQTPMPLRVRLCLLAIIELESSGTWPIDPVDLDREEFLDLLGDDACDRWQKFALALGYAASCRGRVTFPSAARPILASLLSETAPATGPSGHLLDRVRAIVFAEGVRDT